MEKNYIATAAWAPFSGKYEDLAREALRLSNDLPSLLHQKELGEIRDYNAPEAQRLIKATFKTAARDLHFTHQGASLFAKAVTRQPSVPDWVEDFVVAAHEELPGSMQERKYTGWFIASVYRKPENSARANDFIISSNYAGQGSYLEERSVGRFAATVQDHPKKFIRVILCEKAYREARPGSLLQETAKDLLDDCLQPDGTPSSIFQLSPHLESDSFHQVMGELGDIPDRILYSEYMANTAHTDTSLEKDAVTAFIENVEKRPRTERVETYMYGALHAVRKKEGTSSHLFRESLAQFVACVEQNESAAARKEFYDMILGKACNLGKDLYDAVATGIPHNHKPFGSVQTAHLSP